MYCPRCGTLMQGGICPECGFPINRARKKKTLKPNHYQWEYGPSADQTVYYSHLLITPTKQTD